MKKNIFKSTLVVATLAMAGYGGVKAYQMPIECLSGTAESLMMENVEALSNGSQGESGMDFYVRCYCTRWYNTGKGCAVNGSGKSCGVFDRREYPRRSCSYYDSKCE